MRKYLNIYYRTSMYTKKEKEKALALYDKTATSDKKNVLQNQAEIQERWFYDKNVKEMFIKRLAV